MSFWKTLFGGASSQPSNAPPPTKATSSVSTSNLKPGSVVPRTGVYYCCMCQDADSVLRAGLRGYAKGEGLSSNETEAIFKAIGIGSNEPTTRRNYTAGSNFGICPRHKNATGWTLER
jgi:hypothetical protein